VILAENFLRHYNSFMNKHIRGLTAASRQKLLGHHWPGNVRELRNVIERAVILETSLEIEPGSLPDFHLEGRLRKAELPTVTGARSLDELMADFERQLIQSALEQTRYNISRTSEQLKISRHALRYRMQRLNINLDAEEEPAAPPGQDAGA
jgi:transcriptional regulator with PAS, ATPase and Fis domain